MTYLAHTAHAQLGALWLGCVGWTLTAVALGLVQWRVWQVPDTEFISSGVAWVGIWRTCFYTRTVVSDGYRIMHCTYIDLTQDFTPPEIAAGQVLMLLSVLVGLCGNAGGVYALRNVFFRVRSHLLIRPAFIISGGLCLLAALMSLVPLLWNLSSVVTNQTINFTEDFKMPRAPRSQHVGAGIGVGIVGTALMVVTGVIYCTYRLPESSHTNNNLSLRDHVLRQKSLPSLMSGSVGKDNPAFEAHERV
ncbi:claudin-34-like [Mugil cephalus]|uniref:claudin-34-like n=1 Tax=Mugil cephalus TaxID=48193 RepID=UPI001FB5EC95|nr:claudin-34-like [Mugil cephalus]XP_047432891.1 claudin-34-like [Mugil cephalus]